MTTRPGVAVIVVGWNNQALLDDCFTSVYAQTYQPVTLIYVDNGSADRSVAYVNQHHPNVQVIDAGQNLGFAVANNRGFAQALADPACQYVVALNTDARLAPTWVAKLVSFAQDHPAAAGLQGLTLTAADHATVDSAGIYIDPAGAPLQIGYGQPNHGWESREVFGVNAAAALYTRRFLERQPFGADYFDHDLFMYYEDVDLSARAVALGMKNYVVTAAVAYHMGSASSGGNPAFMLRMVHRNLPLVLIKNLPWPVVAGCLPGLVAAETARFVGFWREGRRGLAKAMLVGRLQGLLLIPRFLMKRRALTGRHRPPTTTFKRLMRPH